MPSYLDLGLIVVVLISALLSMLRGFTREVLAIGSWAAAAGAAYYFHPLLLPFVKTYIQKDTIALAVAAGAVFFVTLIIVSILTVRLSDAILDSKVGALDRSLGFLFGAGRGLLLCVVAFVFFNWLVADKNQPDWVKTARTRPLLQATGDQLMAMLPDDPESTFLNRFKKPKSDEPAPEDVTPAPAPGRRTEAVPNRPAPASRGL
jgi:membrane protein required for colicin V production